MIGDTYFRRLQQGRTCGDPGDLCIVTLFAGSQTGSQQLCFCLFLMSPVKKAQMIQASPLSLLYAPVAEVVAVPPVIGTLLSFKALVSLPLPHGDDPE